MELNLEQPPCQECDREGDESCPACGYPFHGDRPLTCPRDHAGHDFNPIPDQVLTPLSAEAAHWEKGDDGLWWIVGRNGERIQHERISPCYVLPAVEAAIRAPLEAEIERIDHVEPRCWCGYRESEPEHHGSTVERPGSDGLGAMLSLPHPYESGKEIQRQLAAALAGVPKEAPNAE